VTSSNCIQSPPNKTPTYATGSHIDNKPMSQTRSASSYISNIVACLCWETNTEEKFMLVVECLSVHFPEYHIQRS